MICYLSQFFLDQYHGQQNVSEFWQPARFNYQSGIDYDVHEPFTKGFNQFMTTKWSTSESDNAYHPDGQSDIRQL